MAKYKSWILNSSDSAHSIPIDDIMYKTEILDT